MYKNSHICNYRGHNPNIVYKKLYFFQFCSLMGQEYKKTGLLTQYKASHYDDP